MDVVKAVRIKSAGCATDRAVGRFAAIADSDVASANAQSGLRSGLPCPVDTPSPKAGFNERQSLGHWCLDCRFSYGS